MFNYLKNKNNSQLSIVLFYALGFLLLVGMMLSVYLNEYVLAFVPLVGLMAIIFFLQPQYLYFIFLAVLPFSMEFEFGGLGLDLPSEPLLIGLSILSLFWFLSHNKEA